ncbi:MAG TPA: hypothetical protein VLH56_19200 [Dissulfurispiraceae bacterium]|nr:hypothetical protein [Dissulfurispiraceae bacterium]
MALARLSLLKSKAFLNISAATYDTELEIILTAASKQVERYCDRTLELTTITDERHTGDLTKRLCPNQWPINTISSVSFYYSDVWNAESTAYFEVIDDTMIYYPKLGQESNSYYGAWPNQPYAIKLTYSAGYATYIGSGSTYEDWSDMSLTDDFPVPEDLEYAVATIASLLWFAGRESEGRLGKSRLIIGDQELILEKDWPKEVKYVLSAYQRPRF